MRVELSNFQAIRAAFARSIFAKSQLLKSTDLTRRERARVREAIAGDIRKLTDLSAHEASDAALYQAFNVATGDSVTILELARRIAAALGRPDLEPHLTSEFREGDIRHCFADTTRAQALLNFKASTPRDAGFAELTAWAADQRPPESTEAANDELRARNLIQRVSR